MLELKRNNNYFTREIKMTKTKTVYFGAGWFNEKQTKAYDAAMEALKANPTIDLENSYVPLANQ